MTGKESGTRSAVELSLPDGVSADVYERVRADAVLGAALDDRILPALTAQGPPEARVAAVHRHRDAAIASWRAVPPGGSDSQATGPGPEAVLADFDKVSTDALRLWFITLAQDAAAGDAPAADKQAELQSLEALARTAFPWDAPTGESVAVRVMLVRAGVK